MRGIVAEAGADTSLVFVLLIRNQMRRIHLVELEDLPWVPAVITDAARDLLDLFFARVRFYAGVLPRLVDLVRASGVRRVIDLGSGGGGGVLTATRALREAGMTDVAVTLTDRFPSAAARERIRAMGDPLLDYAAEPVDALARRAGDPAIRTMFGALHHFRPDDVRRLVGAAVTDGVPIALFDSRAALRKLPVALAPLAALPNMLVLGLVTWCLTPLLRPVRPARWLLTYVLPAIPLLFAWDGTISAMRSYTASEILELARSVPGAERYVWDAGEHGSALYLTGRPA
jgi:hypothetical protein